MLKTTYQHFRRPLLMTAVALILGTMISAILVCYRECRLDPMRVDISWLIVSFGLCALYLILNAFAWTLVLKLFGQALSPATGIRLWIRCEALRWLPGSVWNFGARVAEATKLQIPAVVAAASMIGELILTIASRLLIVAVACACYASTLRTCLAQLPFWGFAIAAGALVVCALILAMFRRQAGRDLLKATPLKQAYAALPATKNNSRKTLTVLLYYVAICALQGLALKFLIAGLNIGGNVPTLALIAINAAAWLVGFVTVFAPSGIVVREAVLATALSTWLSPTHSIAVAVTWRMLQIAVEALLFFVVLVRSSLFDSGRQQLAVPNPDLP